MHELETLYSRLEKQAKKSVGSVKHFVAAGAYRNDGVFVVSVNGWPKHNRVPSAHAEMRLMRKAPHVSEIWIARSSKTGRRVDSCPCKTCVGSLVRSGIKKIVCMVDGKVVRLTIDECKERHE